MWSSDLEFHSAWIHSCENNDVTVATQPSWGRNVQLARLWRTGTFLFHREWEGFVCPSACISVHTDVNVDADEYIHGQNVARYMWVYSCIHVTERVTIVSFFPMDTRDSEHWQYSPKQLLAETGRHWGSMHTIFCWEFSALMITFQWVSGTGPGSVWKAPHATPCWGLCWHPCLAALQGGSPWVHSSHSLEPLPFLSGVRTEYLRAFFHSRVKRSFAYLAGFP